MSVAEKQVSGAGQDVGQESAAEAGRTHTGQQTWTGRWAGGRLKGGRFVIERMVHGRRYSVAHACQVPPTPLVVFR
jgi:hypothetical protein